MSKAAIIYWSGTGNTQIMAEKIAKGIRKTGQEADLMEVSDTKGEDLERYDKVAFGCPAMGDEELEEDDFLPYYEEARKKLAGKKVALFGSYDWGDGEWMRNWQNQAIEDGAILFRGEGLIVNNTPEGESLKECEIFGEEFAGF